MLKTLEKWVIKRLFNRIGEELPYDTDLIKKIWDKYSDEIFEKLIQAIEKIIKNIIAKMAGKEKE